MGLVYILVEIDKDGDSYIIGVADDIDIAESMIKDYFGNSFEKEIFHRDIEDSGIVWKKKILSKTLDETRTESSYVFLYEHSINKL